MPPPAGGKFRLRSPGELLTTLPAPDCALQPAHSNCELQNLVRQAGNLVAVEPRRHTSPETGILAGSGSSAAERREKTRAGHSPRQRMQTYVPPYVTNISLSNRLPRSTDFQPQRGWKRRAP